MTRAQRVRWCNRQERAVRALRDALDCMAGVFSVQEAIVGPSSAEQQAESDLLAAEGCVTGAIRLLGGALESALATPATDESKGNA